MPYVDPEIIAEVKRVDLLTYLQEREPDELVRISPGVYCTKEHDSLKISNGKWFWWSRDLGGRSALDFLVKVRDMAFLDAVEHLRADRPAVASIPARACRPTGERAAPGVSPPTPVRRRRCDAVPRIARHLAQPAEGPRGCRRRLRHHARRGRVRGVRRRDRTGVPRYAALRSCEGGFKGEAPRSDKRFAFSLQSVRNNGVLHVFESAIDALSYATILEHEASRRPAWGCCPSAGCHSPCAQRSPEAAARPRAAS
ncbi:MAG: hypothetical protein ACLTKG_00600 [Collinsella intestinalis]